MALSPQTRRRRRPTPDHPPYSEMVQCAIRDLSEDQGSTESSISAYIRAHYDSLPWAHSRLLSYYLHKLLLAGEICKSPVPNRFILPLNPNPKTSQNPSGPLSPVTGPGCNSRPRLVLKLRRSKESKIDGDGSVFNCENWECLREEGDRFFVHNEESLALQDKDSNRVDGDCEDFRKKAS